jgi:hypothetical protein
MMDKRWSQGSRDPIDLSFTLHNNRASDRNDCEPNCYSLRFTIKSWFLHKLRAKIKPWFHYYHYSCLSFTANNASAPKRRLPILVKSRIVVKSRSLFLIPHRNRNHGFIVKRREYVPSHMAGFLVMLVLQGCWGSCFLYFSSGTTSIPI